MKKSGLESKQLLDFLCLAIETNIEDAVTILRDFPHELRYRIKEIQLDVERAESHEIWGFYEEEYPVYMQREEANELCSVMNVAEANHLVNVIKKRTKEKC